MNWNKGVEGPCFIIWQTKKNCKALKPRRFVDETYFFVDGV